MSTEPKQGEMLLTIKERDQLLIIPAAAYDPVVARWLWLLNDNRRRTLEVIADISESVLTWRPDEEANSIGTLLYHIVAIELDWLYVEILERPGYEAAVTALLPYPVRDATGRLSAVEGESLADHLARLAASRQLLLTELRTLTAADFYRVRRFDPYDVTPEWVLYHVLEHEAGHRGEIGELRRQAERTRE